VYFIAPNNIGLYRAILHIVVDYYFVSTFTSLLNCNQINLNERDLGVFIADLNVPSYNSITYLLFY
jgi:hypothetical protein